MQKEKIKDKNISLKSRIIENRNLKYGLTEMIRKQYNGNKNINLNRRTIICTMEKKKTEIGHSLQKNQNKKVYGKYILALFFIFQE